MKRKKPKKKLRLLKINTTMNRNRIIMTSLLISQLTKRRRRVKRKRKVSSTMQQVKTMRNQRKRRRRSQFKFHQTESISTRLKAMKLLTTSSCSD